MSSVQKAPAVPLPAELQKAIEEASNNLSLMIGEYGRLDRLVRAQNRDIIDQIKQRDTLESQINEFEEKKSILERTIDEKIIVSDRLNEEFVRTQENTAQIKTVASELERVAQIREQSLAKSEKEFAAEHEKQNKRELDFAKRSEHLESVFRNVIHTLKEALEKLS